MPIRRFPIPADNGSDVFETPFPKMLAVKHRGLLVGAAELQSDEYIFYTTPDVEADARVEFESEIYTIQNDQTKHKLVALTIA